MNYRHAFHAGNFADVVKHIIVCLILEYFKRKPGAFRVIDTHAGIGLYDLTSEAAQRSPEWQDGIARLIEKGLPEPAASLIAPYLQAVAAQNPHAPLTRYPGSPVLIRSLLRAQDRLMALELHPEDAQTLAARFARDFQTRVTALDGYLALGAYLPPKEKRGLVLVDPPFEEPGEFARLTEGLVKAHKRFATGTYALWYPLKDMAGVSGFIGALKATGIAKILRIEVIIRRPQDPPRLFGTGMIVVNPPFTLAADLKQLLPPLATLLADEGQGGSRIEWISGE
jgi:23S rRNA (adenine2030-N6)-methyltransferase